MLLSIAAAAIEPRYFCCCRTAAAAKQPHIETHQHLLTVSTFTNIYTEVQISCDTRCSCAGYA
jgi:hypothetical protein